MLFINYCSVISNCSPCCLLNVGGKSIRLWAVTHFMALMIGLSCDSFSFKWAQMSWHSIWPWMFLYIQMQNLWLAHKPDIACNLQIKKNLIIQFASHKFLHKETVKWVPGILIVHFCSAQIRKWDAKAISKDWRAQIEEILSFPFLHLSLLINVRCKCLDRSPEKTYCSLLHSDPRKSLLMGSASELVTLSQRVTFSKKLNRIKNGFSQSVRLNSATGKTCWQRVLI